MKNLIHTLFTVVEPLTYVGSRKNFAVTNGYYWNVAESHGYAFVRGNKNGHSRTYKKGKTRRGSDKQSLAWQLNMQKIVEHERANAECFDLLCGCEITVLTDYNEYYVKECGHNDCCNAELSMTSLNFFIENVSEQYR